MEAIYVYWVSTTMLCLFYLTSATLYLTRKEWVRQTLIGLNFPAPFLVPFMVVIKILGPLALLSRLSVVLSDLAYAGIFFHLILSASAHFGVRRPTGALPAIIGLVLLAMSFSTQNAARETPSPYASAVAEAHIYTTKRS
ncbi:DoxX family protein [Enterobacter cloacae]|uniref:DoxX family protein n=1 Tax=Enterobacter cloacae TaxID=550 RepID=UPI0032DAC9F1